MPSGGVLPTARRMAHVMKIRGWITLALAWLYLSCAGIAVTSRGGETHFMDLCDDENECGRLSCLSGFCTRECATTRECLDLSDTAVCASLSAGERICIEASMLENDGTGGGSTGGRGAGGGNTGGRGTGGRGAGGNQGTGGTEGGECLSPEVEGCPGGGVSDGNVPLTHEEGGWVQACELDLVSVLFTVHDEMGSTISPDCFQGDGSRICVSGRTAQVPDGDWDNYWGALVGLFVCDLDGVNCPDPPDPGWNPGAHGVHGFSFGLSGLLPHLQLTVRTSDEIDYCVVVSSSGSYDLSQFRTECWIDSGEFYDGQDIRLFQWNIVGNEIGASDFDFCITDLATFGENP